MARKKVILTDEYPYHITNRSNNRERFYLPLKELWPICINAIKTLKKDYGCRHHAFVLMPNHYHLVLDTPKLNLSDSIQYFQTEVARRANKKTGRINHFFGGRYKWSLITNETYYWNAFKYIARNPVAAGICKNIEDYPYCSINDPSSKELWAPLSEIENRVDFKWLNEDFSKEKNEAIKKACEGQYLNLHQITINMQQSLILSQRRSNQESLIQNHLFKKHTFFSETIS
jgi:putative transposase